MGTHISRVKSVDLDAWTDEQLRSVLIWGNARANKYWEAKLAPGHVPSEAKIENFIRTKYESKRWVMDGPIPDPATLDADGDDDVPLGVVKEKRNIERSASSYNAVTPAVQSTRNSDLFGDDTGLSARPKTTSPPISRPAPKADPAPPKQTKPADSLLGLDFFGAPEPPPNRPASAAAAPTGQSRPDLKQSILSLYAASPRPQPQSRVQQPPHSSHSSFSGIQSPPGTQQSPPSFGEFSDAFSGLSFSSPTGPSAQPQNSKSSAFAGLGNISGHQSTPSESGSSGSNFGRTGSFFDSKPAQTVMPQPNPERARTFSASSGFGAFSSAPGISPQATIPPASSSGLGDLFDFSASPVSQTTKQTAASSPQHNSVFNLTAKQQPRPTPAKASPASSGWNNADAWGSNEAWSSVSSSTTKVASPVARQPPLAQTSTNDFGWNYGGSLANKSIVVGESGAKPSISVPPKVSVDEDFGGWSSAAPVTPGSGTVPKKSTGGYANSEDLFSNVWK